MSLTATLLQDAIVEVGNGKYGDFERRLSNYGALQAFSDNADMMIPEGNIEEIKQSAVQTEKVPSLNKFTSTLITTPTCAITGARPTSAFTTLTWGFKGFEVYYIPSQNQGNYIKERDDLGMQMRMGWKTVFGNLDTVGASTLETNKSTSLASSFQKNITTEAGDYLYAGKPEELFLSIPGLMSINDIEGPFNDIANSEASSTMAKIEAFGANNYYDLATNKVAMMGQYRHYTSNRIVPGDGLRETHFFAPEGTLGVYNWIDYDARVGQKAGNKEWSNMKDPMFGFDWAVYSVDDCIDDTALMGNARVYGKKLQIGAWFAFLTSYTSDTTSPIIKVNLTDPA